MYAPLSMGSIIYSEGYWTETSHSPTSEDDLYMVFMSLPRQISECPCGHSAQLWEKVLGGREGERYLCFTKAEKVGPSCLSLPLS